MKRLIIATALLTGCATPYVNPYLDGKHSAANASQTSGYEDGCNSGSAATGNILKRYKQDVRRYNEDVSYKGSWDAGFHTCKGQGDMINRSIRGY
jgi:hypothetical protein